MSKTINMLLNDEDGLLVLKHKLETDFLYFVRFFFYQMTGQRFILSHHHEKIAETLLKTNKKCTPWGVF